MKGDNHFGGGGMGKVCQLFLNFGEMSMLWQSIGATRCTGELSWEKRDVRVDGQKLHRRKVNEKKVILVAIFILQVSQNIPSHVF